MAWELSVTVLCIFSSAILNQSAEDDILRIGITKRAIKNPSGGKERPQKGPSYLLKDPLCKRDHVTYQFGSNLFLHSTFL